MGVYYSSLQGNDIMKIRTDLYCLLVPAPGRFLMNRIENKKNITDAAKYFKEEILASMRDVPRKELCDMVDDYIYYQTDDVSKDEAHAAVEATCLFLN
jgi:hypothetical protein